MAEGVAADIEEGTVVEVRQLDNSAAGAMLRPVHTVAVAAAATTEVEVEVDSSLADLLRPRRTP